MAPNIIGSSFILAETALNSDDTANNNRKRTSSVCATSSTNSNTNNDRVPVMGDLIVGKDCGTAAIAAVSTEKPKKEYRLEIVWRNVVIFIILHMFGLYGLYLIFAENAYLAYLFGYGIGTLGGFGITAGAHRLWSHKAYKAKWPMRVFLMICQSIAFQNSIYEWVRDHRVHHKFTDTNADPHNSRRGFFFSHMGWLMCKKHPDVREKGKLVDMSDLDTDAIVMFQKKYYFYIMPVCCFIVPALIPYFYFGYSIKVCFFTCSIFRYVQSLHYTWLVNSAAHFYGMKPYDNFISSANNKLVSILACGEGWHNYHHVFPWDYKAAELGTYTYNWSTALIDFFAKLGLAYDLKTVSDEMIRKRVIRTGDGSHAYASSDINNNSTTEEMILQLNHDNEENLVWGWDDADMRDDDRKSYVFGTFGGFGITAGAHRLWSHRSYKAKWPMRFFLMICQSIAFQNSIHEWVRDHRVHHKFTDTNADPHNSRRGFFFSHMGWLMCKKHPDVKEKGKQIDMSDLEADPIVMFQKRYYFYIMPVCCFIMPALIPYFYFGFSLKICFFTCSMLRYVMSLHYTWLVNSAAHFYGMRPYDNFISSTNNKLVSILAYGEGWHNYHHVFPWDYKAAELGTYTYNWSTALINFFAKLGLAYDLKTVSDEMIRKRVIRTGDGSHAYASSDINNNSTTEEMILQLNHDNEENLVWGWDDADMRDDDRKSAFIIKKDN